MSFDFKQFGKLIISRNRWPFKKINILHILTNLELGGAQISTVDICIGLRQLGFNIYLAYSTFGGRASMTPPFLSQKLSHHAVPAHDIPAMRRSINIFMDFMAVIQLLILIKKIKPQIVHTHMSKAGILGRLAAAMAGVPHILHSVRGWSFYCTDKVFNRKLFILLERWAGRYTKRFLAVSSQLSEDGLKEGIGAEEIYTVVRSGIKLDSFRLPKVNRDGLRKQLGIPIEAHVIGGVMGLEECKAPYDFLEVAEHICYDMPEAHFLLIGDGPYHHDLQERIIEKGLLQRFHLLGLRSDVPRLMAIMDIFLLTSHWEGLPRVLIEAMAANIPIVATSVGGVPELFTHGVNGFLCPKGDTTNLTYWVMALIKNPNLRQELAIEARKRVREEFDITWVINKYASIYEEMLHMH